MAILKIKKNEQWIPILGHVDSGGRPMMIETITSPEVVRTLISDVEYRCQAPVTLLSIEGFMPGEENIVEQWSIVFTTGESISVDYPDTIKWAFAAPVWDPNTTYWLSFVRCQDKYLGVWSRFNNEQKSI